MDRRVLLGGLALAASLPAVAARASRSRPGLEVLTTHLANADQFGGSLRPDQHLVLRREHSRAFDPSAVAVDTTDGHRLGYLPPVQAGVLSRLLDHGASAHAVVTATGQLRVFLHLA